MKIKTIRDYQKKICKAIKCVLVTVENYYQFLSRLNLKTYISLTAKLGE